MVFHCETTIFMCVCVGISTCVLGLYFCACASVCDFKDSSIQYMLYMYLDHDYRPKTAVVLAQNKEIVLFTEQTVSQIFPLCNVTLTH